MLEITQQARLELHEMLEGVLSRSDVPEAEALGFRLVAAGDDGDRAELALTVDAVREGDEVFVHEGRHILLVDGSAAPLVDGLVLDVVEAGDGRRLGLRQG